MATMIPGYSEKPGTRKARHLRKGDEIKCSLGHGTPEEWRAVLDVTVAFGKGAPVFVSIAAPEAPAGAVDVQLPQDLIVYCDPAPVEEVES